MNNQTAHIIGVGPGNPDLIPVASQKLLSKADWIAGFKTVNGVVKKWASPKARYIHLSYNDQEEGLDKAALLASEGSKVVFTAWGDFNFSGNELVERVETACRKHCIKLEYVPGISSLQIAFAKVRLPVEESIFITLHRREGLDVAKQELLKYVRENQRHLFVLPHTFDMMPTTIATFLRENGLPDDCTMIVMEKLTSENEQITRGTIKEISNSSKAHSDLSIVVIPKTESMV